MHFRMTVGGEVGYSVILRVHVVTSPAVHASLEPGVAGIPGEGDGVTDVVHTGAVLDEALETQPEPRVGHRSVPPQIQIPLVRLQIQLLRAERCMARACERTRRVNTERLNGYVARLRAQGARESIP